MAKTAVNDEGWECPFDRKKQLCICEQMSLKEGRLDDPFPHDAQFRKEDLLNVVPSDMKAHLNWKATGDPCPGRDSEPIHATVDSLRRHKSSISHCMPNRHAPWIDGRSGNPTRHQSITTAPEQLERLETAGRGVAPNDKRPHRDAECSLVLELLRKEREFETRM